MCFYLHYIAKWLHSRANAGTLQGIDISHLGKRKIIDSKWTLMGYVSFKEGKYFLHPASGIDWPKFGSLQRPTLTYAPLGGDNHFWEAEGTINFWNANQTYLYSKQPYLKRPSHFFHAPKQMQLYVKGVVPIGNPCHWHIYILTYQKNQPSM